MRNKTGEPSLEGVLAEAQKNKRVCPMPRQWNALFELLPNTRRVGNAWEPGLPLILGAWWHASDGDKRQRLREHIEWAAAHGALAKLDAFLRSLDETEWYHFGE